jgi:hypothetical protein
MPHDLDDWHHPREEHILYQWVTQWVALFLLTLKSKITALILKDGKSVKFSFSLNASLPLSKIRSPPEYFDFLSIFVSAI